MKKLIKIAQEKVQDLVGPKKKYKNGRGPDLLWDKGYTWEAKEKIELSNDAYVDLNLDKLVKLLDVRFGRYNRDGDYRAGRTKEMLQEIFQYPFIKPDLVKKRQDVLEDLLTDKKIFDGVNKGLNELESSVKLKRDASRTNRYGDVEKIDYRDLYDAATTRIKAYQTLRDTLKEAKSEKLREGFEYLDTITSDERFKEAMQLIKRMKDGSYTFKLQYSKDGNYPKITLFNKNAAVSENGEDGNLTMQNSLSQGIADSFYKAIVGFIDGILGYIDDGAFMHSLDAYSSLASHLKSLEKKGMKFCKPEIVSKEKRTLKLEEAVNPLLVNSETLVSNDVDHDPEQNMFVITGANNGGKTTYLKTVGLLQVLAQSGLYVPAKKAVISPVDQIYTHFVTADDITEGEGRYRNELERLKRIFKKITPYSLVLIDEPCGGTSVKEGKDQSIHILDAFHRMGCPTYFSTHIHEIADVIEDGKFPAARNLQVEINENAKGLEYTYRVIPGKAGKSYAVEVAEKYEMGPEQLQEMIDGRIGEGKLDSKLMRPKNGPNGNGK